MGFTGLSTRYLNGEVLGNQLPIDSDLDVLRFDVDPVDERHEDGSGRVWCKRGEFL